jgi:cytoskeletal protein RodZ
MIPIAMILLAIVILFCVAVVVSNPVPVTLSLFGAQIPLQTPAVFFTGAATMLVTVVALWLLRVGFRRERAQRKELKSLKKAAKTDSTGAGSRPVGGTTGTRPARPAVDSAQATPQQATTPAPPPQAPTAQVPAAQAPTAPAPTAQARPAPADPSNRPTTSADREALLAEVEDATRDEPPTR